MLVLNQLSLEVGGFESVLLELVACVGCWSQIGGGWWF